MEEDSELKFIKTSLRAVLQSHKGGVEAHRLIGDYRELVLEPIPYRKRGFATLEQFLQTLPDVVLFTRRGGEIVYQPVADASSAHIQRMVGAQRSKKPSAKKGRYTPQRRPVAHSTWGRPQNFFNPAPQRRVNIYHQSSQYGHARKDQMQITKSYTPNQASITKSYKQAPPPRFQKQYGAMGDANWKPSPLPDLSAKANTTGAKDYKSILNNYSQKMRLTPMYDTTKFSDGSFASSLTVGEETFGSGVLSSKHEAEQAAAENACDHFGVNPGASLGSLPLRQVVNESVLKERTKELLRIRSNGLWNTRLPHEYRDMFKEEPPEQWLSMLQNWTDMLRIDSVSGTGRAIIYLNHDASTELTQNTQQTKSSIAGPPLPAQGETISEVFLCYVVNFQEFYVQRGHSKIEDLMRMIQETYQKNSDALRPNDIPPGAFCIAQYRVDNMYYRAQIVNEENAENEVIFEVRYVDYGNREKVSRTQIRQIVESVSAMPEQCIRCSLDGVYPIQGQWREECKTRFNDLMKDGVALQLVSSNDETGCSVNLLNKHKRCINQILIDEGYASSAPTSEEPSHVMLPEESEELEVFVCYVESSTKVMIRLFGEEHSEKLEELEERLSSLRSLSPPTKVFLGVTYAACLHDEAKQEDWYRVRVTETKPEEKCVVEFLDHGGIEEVSHSCLRVLPPKFNRLPYQSVEVKLTGLEHYANDSVLTAKLGETLIGKIVIATIDDRIGKVSVTMYDTSGDSDVNVNEESARSLYSAEELKPELPEVNEYFEAYVTCIHENGNVSIQLSEPGPCSLALDEIYNQLNGKLYEGSSADSFVEDPSPDMLVAAFLEEQKRWTRAKIVALYGRKVVLNFVDYGHRVVCSKSTLRRLPESAKSLPPQAIECNVTGITPDGDTLTLLTNLLPPQEIQSMKIVTSPTSNSLAEVEIEILIDNFGIDRMKYAPHDEPTAIGNESHSTNGAASRTEPPAVSRQKMPESSSIYSPTKPNHLCSEDVPLPGTPKSVISSKEYMTAPLPDTPERTPDRETIRPERVHRKSSADSSCQTDPGILLEYISSLHVTSNTAEPSETPSTSCSDVSMASGTSQVSIQTIDINENRPVPDDYMPAQTSIPVSGDTVFITWVSDPQNFRLIKMSCMKTLDDMMIEMNEYYQSNSSQLPEVTKPVRGNLYAGQFSDGQWYRVLVLLVLDPSTQMVSIRFVDYGDCHVIQRCNLRELPGTYRKLSFQAINGKLAGVEAPNGTWSEETMEFFHTRIIERSLTAWIHGDFQGSDFVAMTLLDGKSFIHKELIEKNLAIKM